MFIKYIRCTLLSLLGSVILTGGQITITGQYVDKKSNPIADASVEYIANSTQLDNTNTDENGDFTLTIETLGIEDETIPEQFSLSQNYPNPFNPETRIQCRILFPATLTLYDLRGHLVDRIHLAKAGRYDISWGGANRFGKPVAAGIYFMVLDDGEKQHCRKLTLLDSGNGSPLRIEGNRAYNSRAAAIQKITNTLDEIRFTKSNTSIINIQLYSPTRDTSLGVITGNVGPTFIKEFPDFIIPKYDTLIINVADYIYNDSETRYSHNDTIYSIIDSIAVFVAEGDERVIGHTNCCDFTAKDVIDNTLSDTKLICVEVPLCFNPILTVPESIRIPHGKRFNILFDNLDQYIYNPENYLITEWQTDYDQKYNPESPYHVINGSEDGGLPLILELKDSLWVGHFTLEIDGLCIIPLYYPDPEPVLGERELEVYVDPIPFQTKEIPILMMYVGDTIDLDYRDYFDYHGSQPLSLTIEGLDLTDYTTLENYILRFVPVESQLGYYDSLRISVATPYHSVSSNRFDLKILESGSPIINLPTISIIEDTEQSLLFKLSDYSNDPNGDLLTYSVFYQSNPNLANLVITSDSLRVGYLKPDGYGSSLIGVRSSDGELSDTAYFTLKVTPVADVTFKHVHFKTNEEIQNNTFTINDSVYTDVDSVKLQVNTDSVSVDVLHEYYWPQIFWVSRDSVNGNIGQKDAMNPCNLSLDSLDQTLFIHSVHDSIDMGNIAKMIDGFNYPKGLDRFVTDTLTVWVMPGYDIPNTSTLAYLEEVTFSDGKDGIKYISNYDFATKFQYLGDAPKLPYISVLFDKRMPRPGSHGESVDYKTNIIQSASLSFNTNVTKTDIMAEIRQTLHQRTDSPIGWGWGTADSLGRPIYSVKMHDVGVIAYNFEPGTKFNIWSKSASNSTATPAYEKTFRRSD